MLCIPLFIYDFSYSAALIVTPFTGKRRVLKSLPERIPNFRCVVQMALSPCQLQTILLNLCEFFSPRPMSMQMERSFGLTGLHIFNRTFNHTITQWLSHPLVPNSIEPSPIP